MIKLKQLKNGPSMRTRNLTGNINIIFVSLNSLLPILYNVNAIYKASEPHACILIINK